MRGVAPHHRGPNHPVTLPLLTGDAGDDAGVVRHVRGGCTFKTCCAVATFTLRRDAGLPLSIHVRAPPVPALPPLGAHFVSELMWGSWEAGADKQGNSRTHVP